jgi:hypothetical protein
MKGKKRTLRLRRDETELFIRNSHSECEKLFKQLSWSARKPFNPRNLIIYVCFYSVFHRRFSASQDISISSWTSVTDDFSLFPYSRAVSSRIQKQTRVLIEFELWAAQNLADSEKVVLSDSHARKQKKVPRSFNRYHDLLIWIALKRSIFCSSS